MTLSESAKSKLMRFSAHTVRKREADSQCVPESTGCQAGVGVDAGSFTAWPVPGVSEPALICPMYLIALMSHTARRRKGRRRRGEAVPGSACTASVGSLCDLGRPGVQRSGEDDRALGRGSSWEGEKNMEKSRGEVVWLYRERRVSGICLSVPLSSSRPWGQTHGAPLLRLSVEWLRGSSRAVRGPTSNASVASTRCFLSPPCVRSARQASAMARLQD